MFGCGSQEKADKAGSGGVDAIRQAEAAAIAWITLVDEGKYAESYDQGSGLMQKAMPQEQWVKTLEGIRPAFGKAVKREVRSSQYATSLPGAPDGEYVVMVFNTEFEKKKDAQETCTAMKEGDAWKVSGYFIK
jgi:hypothetical protein